MTNNWLPQWVALPPPRERFPDPLGFQADVDDLANRFLPGITTLTERVRYYSFLCWSLRMSGGNSRIIWSMDRHLAICEYMEHYEDLKRGDISEDGGEEDAFSNIKCRFRGVRLLRPYDGKPPRWLKRITWEIYRKSMSDLGMVQRVSRSEWQLTDLGEELADAYGGSIRRNGSYPLLCIWGSCRWDPGKRKERQLLKEILFDKGPRGQMALFLRRHGIRNADEALGLALRYRNCPPIESNVLRSLWLAAIHELACRALNALFGHWYLSEPRLSSSYIHGLPRRIKPQRSLDTNLDIINKQEVWQYVWSRCKGVWHAISSQGGTELRHTTAGKILAEIMQTTNGIPPRSIKDISQVASILFRTHYEAKGGDLWWDLDDGHINRIRKNVEPRITRHNYRIDSAISLIKDLR